MTQHRWFSILCGALIVAALSVSLMNVSTFARLFEPADWLAWSWACYVDLALTGYTIAYVYLRARNQRTGIVRFGFYWFIALSLVANITVVLSRYDVSRGASVISDALNSDTFLFVACVIYGASIPLSVLTFAHTIADAVGSQAKTRTRTVRKPAAKIDNAVRVAQARKTFPEADKRRIARELGLSYSTVRKWWSVSTA